VLAAFAFINSTDELNELTNSADKYNKERFFLLSLKNIF
jgi:hypothetical protein